MDEMLTLYGVARKTANVVLNNAFNLPTGVIVDTHVQRVSRRMGLSEQKNPEKIERDLMELVPKDEWVFFGPAMVLHGRYTCTFHSPACAECLMKDVCPQLGVGEEGDSEAEAPENEEDTPAMATKKTATKKKAAAATTKPAAPKAAEPVADAVTVPSLREQLPADWREVLKEEFDKPYFKQLEKFLAEQRAAGAVYPPAEDVFNAFKATPFDKVKVLLLGQDPYHGAGEAHGMCFSVKPGVKIPPSLVNVYKEMQDDLGCKPVAHGHLASWAGQGVFLLNTVLTVKANQANSHRDQGWETFTDAVIKALSARPKPLVALLWGKPAQAKETLIDAKRHRVLKSGHPSPLSSKTFFGTKPFSSANAALKDLGQEPISWQLPDSPTQAAPAPVPAAALPASKVSATQPAPAPVVPAGPTRLEQLMPEPWRKALAAEVQKPYFRQLDQSLAAERRTTTVCPSEESTFAALEQTPPEGVRVVLLGQEPVCASDVADGLAFSVRDGVEPSEVIRTIGRELRRDLGCRSPVSGSLRPWARQGVLLLNTVLTVREGRPGSHKDKGWETFADAVLKLLGASSERIVFVLLGPLAAKKRALIAEGRHVVLTAAHPAQAPAEFVGSGLFSQVNAALETGGRSGVYWQLPFA
jgi:uracil-DNA glycosylase